MCCVSYLPIKPVICILTHSQQQEQAKESEEKTICPFKAQKIRAEKRRAKEDKSFKPTRGSDWLNTVKHKALCAVSFSTKHLEHYGLNEHKV